MHVPIYLDIIALYRVQSIGKTYQPSFSGGLCPATTWRASSKRTCTRPQTAGPRDLGPSCVAQFPSHRQSKGGLGCALRPAP